MSEHDAALSAEAAFGAALDDDLAANIPLVGFADDDAGGFGDLAFIGFDDEAPRPSGVGADGRRPAGLRQRLGGLLRAAASAARLAAPDSST